MPLHFTTEITLGNLAIVVTLIGIAIKFGRSLGTLTTTVSQHSSTLDRHTTKMERHEERLTSIAGDLQRLIGRVEATQDRLDRSTGQRRGEGGY